MGDDAPKISRRGMFRIAGAVAATGAAVGAIELWPTEGGHAAPVFIGRVGGYEADLVDLVRRGLAEIGVDAGAIRGKRILLKPNLVETSRDHPHINTHPAVVVAAAEVLRSLDAAEVRVGEGQGHRRDSRLVLAESCMGEALRDARIPFVDLNHDDPVAVDNAASNTNLHQLWLPRSVLDADLVVTMPKVKTHHWAGVTCAMKNLFGVMPGVIYGWPKNPLHREGIHESIVDINATVRPGLAIADGIIGMEGDGPIMGTPKALGAVVMGRSSIAVDATVTRLMGMDPGAVAYLAMSSGVLGPIESGNVEQRGEPIDALATRFETLDLPHLERLTSG